MKTNLILGVLLVLSIFSNAQFLNKSPDDDGLVCETMGAELIANGDFNSGNTGFTSGYTYLSGCAPGGIDGDGISLGKYHLTAITTCYAGHVDRYGLSGNILHFPDIQTATSGKIFWAQSVAVTPGKTYKLSLWVYEPNGNCAYQASGTMFNVYINNVLIQADNVGGCGAWYNKIYTWHPGPNTTANIEIKNGTGNFTSGTDGMDILFDDISLKECIPPSPCENQGKELVTNGDFDSGNIGFTSGYNYVASSASSIFGSPGVVNNYHLVAISTAYTGYVDRNGLNGNMLHFPDIQITNAGVNFWEQTINVTPGKTYNLSFWVYEPNNNCDYQALGTNFDVYINGYLVQLDIVGGCGIWYDKHYSWYSGTNTTVQIEIKTGANNYTSSNLSGMDLLLDDISLKECIEADGDPEGKSMTSTGISNSQDQQNGELTIMPNPSNGNTVLKSSADMEIKIIDKSGQIIRTIDLNERNNHREVLSNLNVGIYFIKAYSHNNFIQRKLVITP